MWGTWLATFGLIFSKMSTIPHTAYMSSLAPPLAALSAAGLVMFWRAYRADGRRGWLLPLAVAAEVAWAYSCGGTTAASCPGCRLRGRGRRGRGRGPRRGQADPPGADPAGHGRAHRRRGGGARRAGRVGRLRARSHYAGSSFNATAGPAGGLGGGANTPGPGVAAAGGIWARRPP